MLFGPLGVFLMFVFCNCQGFDDFFAGIFGLDYLIHHLGGPTSGGFENIDFLTRSIQIAFVGILFDTFSINLPVIQTAGLHRHPGNGPGIGQIDARYP